MTLDTTTTPLRKYLISDDRQSEFGSWPVDTPDDDIWAEMERNTGLTRDEMGGSIAIGEWTDGVNQ